MPTEDWPDVLEQPADGTPHSVVGFRVSGLARIIREHDSRILQERVILLCEA
jgi:hypothetical protein